MQDYRAAQFLLPISCFTIMKKKSQLVSNKKIQTAIWERKWKSKKKNAKLKECDKLLMPEIKLKFSKQKIEKIFCVGSLKISFFSPLGS